MRFTTILPLLLAAGVARAQFGQGQNGQGQQGQGQQGQGQQGQGQGQNGQNQGQGQNGQNGQNQGGNNNGGNANANELALDPNNVQTNSQSDGLEQAEEGQAASVTDNANFINFCTGKTLTNGLQVQQGSCNGIVMGDIPAAAKMVSAAMQFPKDGDFIQVDKDINFQVKINNLEAGTFTNPDVTYYAAPQALGQSGGIIGHTHITVQDITQSGDEPPDAQEFAFFKGINDAGDGNGLLSAALAGGLQAGTFRVCSMTSAANHQPVIMPVAQRGAQDDCVRFTVNAAGADPNANGGNAANGGNNNNNNNNQGQNGQNGQQGQQGQQAQQGQQGQQAQQGQQGQQAQQGQGQQAAQGGQQAAQGGQQGGQFGGGQGGQFGGGRRGRGRGRFAARAYIA